MPKGKPKAKNPELYKDTDSEEQEKRNGNPKAPTHVRGGRWEVKDELKTGTHWDEMHHVDLKRAAEDAGVFIKDMSKVAMIHALAKKDHIDEMERRAADRERRRKKRLRQIQEKRKQAEIVKKKIARQRRRMQGEDYVSDTTESESDAFHVETDEESHTTTTPSTPSIAPIDPAQRLRIYEWPYGDMPPTNPPQASLSKPNTKMETELLPKKLPYAVMKLVTTISKEKLELPGRRYCEEIGPDFVLPLSEHTKDCARNGILYGQLHQAVIERGADWAKRTIVQWWNGCMYFNLPPRGSSKKVLADVYAKWNKKKRISKIDKSKYGGIHKAESKRRVAQQLQDERQKMIDIYAVSEHRPPICYMPAYLDYPLMDDDEDVEKSIDNLFYIRFADMDLPHYYFWSVPDWQDPTQPNPDWLHSDMEDVQYQTTGTDGLTAADYRNSNVSAPTYDTLNTVEPYSQTIRVKRTPVPHKFRPSTVPPKTSQYKAAIWAFEKDLYNKGLGLTLREARERWIQEGKLQEWMHLIKNLPILFPAGHLPSSPPVNPPPQVRSLAEKFARIEVPSEQRPIESIIGDEPWTRDDEAYWNIVELPVVAEGNEHELLRTMSPTTPCTLERRLSEEMPRVTAWVRNIPVSTYSPSFPPRRRSSTPSLMSSFDLRQKERAAWENRFLHNIESDAVLSSTIEQMPVSELKHNLYLLMQKQQFTHRHHDDPFDHQWVEHDGKHLRSSTITDGIDAISAVPRTKDTQATKRNADNRSQSSSTKRKMSKVSFSPVTVERRVAYNDTGNTYDANVSTIAATSPRRSSLKRPTFNSNAVNTSALTIDTNTGTSSNRAKTQPCGTKRTTAAAAPKQRTSSTHRADAAWSPGDYSSSEYTPSPHLPIIKHGGNNLPDAAWNPRKPSKSSVESLEYLNNNHGSRKKSKVTTTLESNSSIDHEVLADAKNTRGQKRKSTGKDDEKGQPSPKVKKLDPHESQKSKHQNILSTSSTPKRSTARMKSTVETHLNSFNALLPNSDDALGDLIPSTSSALDEDHSSDFLNGKPFGPPPKKKKPLTRSKSKRTLSERDLIPERPESPPSIRSKTPKEIALETKKAAASNDLASRRAAKLGKNNKKTAILGNPHVEPLILAPARRRSKKSAEPLSDILSPPTPATDSKKNTSTTQNKTAINTRAPEFLTIHNHAIDTSDDQLAVADSLRRGRRSSAPTPSPSLASPRTSSMSTTKSNVSLTLINPIGTQPLRQHNNEKQNPTPSTSPTVTSKTKRKHSYDVPYSDSHLIAPPTTPADHLAVAAKPKTRRTQRSASVPSTAVRNILHSAGGSEKGLHVGESSDKIKEVQGSRTKTVRGKRKRGSEEWKGALDKDVGRGKESMSITTTNFLNAEFRERERQTKKPIVQSVSTSSKRASDTSQAPLVIRGKQKNNENVESKKAEARKRGAMVSLGITTNHSPSAQSTRRSARLGTTKTTVTNNK